MRLLYNADGGVFYAVYDRDLFAFSHTTNIPLLEFDIDEIAPTNQVICQDLYRTQWKFDIHGQRKYYVLDEELYSRDGWEEMRI